MKKLVQARVPKCVLNENEAFIASKVVQVSLYHIIGHLYFKQLKMKAETG